MAKKKEANGRQGRSNFLRARLSGTKIPKRGIDTRVSKEKGMGQDGGAGGKGMVGREKC